MLWLPYDPSCASIGLPFCWSIGRSVIISWKGGKFHAPIGELVSFFISRLFWYLTVFLKHLNVQNWILLNIHIIWWRRFLMVHLFSRFSELLPVSLSLSLGPQAQLKISCFSFVCLLTIDIETFAGLFFVLFCFLFHFFDLSS